MYASWPLRVTGAAWLVPCGIPCCSPPFATVLVYIPHGRKVWPKGLVLYTVSRCPVAWGPRLSVPTPSVRDTLSVFQHSPLPATFHSFTTWFVVAHPFISFVLHSRLDIITPRNYWGAVKSSSRRCDAAALRRSVDADGRHTSPTLVNRWRDRWS
jgi:hypothetical protein